MSFNRLEPESTTPTNLGVIMRLKIFVPLLALTLSAGAATVARAQEDEELVRGSFLTTRVNTSGKSTSGLIAGSANQAASSGTSSTGKTTSGGRTTTGRRR